MTASSRPPRSLADRLDALLPQTQCTRCGFADCRAYAEALADGVAEANRCPPGGAEGVRRLSRELGLAPRPLDPECGVEGPRLVVRIDESRCIGCALCVQACPVDAIIGAPKRMHTVIEADCTGCELCLPACPVDCLLAVEASGARTGWDAWTQASADEARARHRARSQRLARDEAEHAQRLAAPPGTSVSRAAAPADTVVPRADRLEAALARARARLRAPGGDPPDSNGRP